MVDNRCAAMYHRFRKIVLELEGLQQDLEAYMGELNPYTLASGTFIDYYYVLSDSHKELQTALNDFYYNEIENGESE